MLLLASSQGIRYERQGRGLPSVFIKQLVQPQELCLIFFLHYSAQHNTWHVVRIFKRFEIYLFELILSLAKIHSINSEGLTSIKDHQVPFDQHQFYLRFYKPKTQWKIENIFKCSPSPNQQILCSLSSKYIFQLSRSCLLV